MKTTDSDIVDGLGEGSMVTLRIYFLITWLMVMAAGELAGNAAATFVRVSTHPISITQCDAFVTRTKTTLRIKSFADDLELIQGVEANDQGFYDPNELRLGIADHGEFLLERIELIDAKGERLKGKIVETEPFEIPEQGLMSGQLMEHTMGWTIEYAYENAPEYLTFKQDIVDENYLFPSELKLLLKQSGSEAPYAANVKPGQAETIRFDWDRPPLGKEASGDEWRDWFEEQREKTLGITSYGSVYSFIYITPLEVRHEVLIPLANLATLVEFDQADPSYLEIEEQDAAKTRIEEFFSSGNPVEVNSKIVAPRFDRIDFYGLDLRDFAIQAERRRVSMANGRVGIIMAYPCKQVPDAVSITWDKFSSTLMNVEAVVFAMDKIEKTKFSKFLTENVFRWENPGYPPLPELVPVAREIEFQKETTPLPLVAAGCLGLLVIFQVIALFGKNHTGLLALLSCGLAVGCVLSFPYWQKPVVLPGAGFKPISPDDARPIFAQLHQNLFRAFDYYEEQDVYDALEASTDGIMLREIYLQMRESLAVKEQGGAISRIDAVEMLEGRVSQEDVQGTEVAAPGFAYRCRWNLVGTVEHWGHIHQRTNSYDAIFNVQNIDGAWKFTNFETLDEQQGIVKTSLRKF